MELLPGRVAIGYGRHMGHYYHFKRGDRVTIVSGRYRGCTGLVDSAVFQRTVGLTFPVRWCYEEVSEHT